MKKLSVMIFLICSLLLSAAVLKAQDEPYRYSGMCGDRAGYMTDYLNTKLNLSSGQYDQVYKIFLAHEEQRDKDFETYTDRDEFRNASEKRREKLLSDLKEVLTPDQYEQFTQDQNTMFSKMNKRFGHRRHMMH